MSATCNSCGACCDPVVLPFSQVEVLTAPAWLIDDETRRWALEDLTPIPYEQGKEQQALFMGPGDIISIGLNDKPVHEQSFYECRHFDKATRLCTDYENRPPPCRDYPWRDGDTADRGRALPLTCSYREDIDQRVYTWEELRDG